jgi:hypothetical protein
MTKKTAFLSTVILSFLKPERDRTVTVILQTFQIVYFVQYDRFMTVHRSRPFPTIPDRP